MQLDTEVPFTGAPLTTWHCGCELDDHGAVWTPCPAIRGTHAAARYLTSTGQPSALLTACLVRIQAHVAEQRVVVVGEQGGLL